MDSMIDEPLIVPITPGEVLIRLAQVTHIIGVRPGLADASFTAALPHEQTRLLDALSKNDPAAIRAAQSTAQEALQALYRASEGSDDKLLALGFPTPAQLKEPTFIAAPDEKSISLTYTLCGKQVMTSLAFDRVAGATGYWLHVVRYWEEQGETQRIEDPILESAVPLFPRVRLAVGKQILRLKSRNLSVSAISNEFEIDVPQL